MPVYFHGESKKKKRSITMQSSASPKLFIPTWPTREAFALLDSAQWGPPEVSALFGAPGTGKTLTLREYARSLNRSFGERRILYLEPEPGIGRVGLLQALLDRLAPGVRAVEGRLGLSRVEHRLRSAGTRLLLVDDAHRLYKPTLEMLTAVFSRCGLPVVLCGPRPELVHRLEQVPQLKARVGRIRELEPLRRDDVELALGHLAGFRLEDPRRAAFELHRRSQGNWGRLVRLLARCQEQLSPAPRLGRRQVVRASRDLGLDGGEAA